METEPGQTEFSSARPVPTDFLHQVDKDIAASTNSEGKLKWLRPNKKKKKKEKEAAEKAKADAQVVNAKDLEIQRSILEEQEDFKSEKLLPEQRRQLQIEKDAVLESAIEYR